MTTSFSTPLTPPSPLLLSPLPPSHPHFINTLELYKSFPSPGLVGPNFIAKIKMNIPVLHD